MSRYIDADALECDTEWSEYHDGFISYSQLEMDTAPSIDIVRCKECMRYEEDSVGWYCDRYKRTMQADDFCCYGERESDE